MDFGICKICDSCQAKGLAENAVVFCRICNESYCDSCASYHKGFKLTRDHSLTGLSQTLERIVKSDIIKLQSHPDEITDSDFERFITLEKENDGNNVGESSSDFDGFFKHAGTEPEPKLYRDIISVKMAQVATSKILAKTPVTQSGKCESHNKHNTGKGNNCVEDHLPESCDANRSLPSEPSEPYFPCDDKTPSKRWGGPMEHHPQIHRGRCHPPHPFRHPHIPFGRHPPPPFGHPPPPFGHPPPPFGAPPPPFLHPRPPPSEHAPPPFGHPHHRPRHGHPRHHHRQHHPHFQTGHDD